MHVMKTRSGYTLVEVVVSIAVGMIIIGAIYAAVIASQRFTVQIDRRIVAGQDARAVLDLMTLEMQMASFNPNYSTTLWKNPANCSDPASNMTYKGIQAATASSVSIEADLYTPAADPDDPPISVSDGVIGGGSPNEIITYNYDATNQYITRETSCGGAQPFLGDRPSSGRPRAVRVINTEAVPVFRYFNGQGTEIPVTGLPAGIPNIARIDITLWVETEDADGKRRQMVYATSIIPRNHVINVSTGS
jgi:type II secretory pathway pseudopilin PulG